MHVVLFFDWIFNSIIFLFTMISLFNYKLGIIIIWVDFLEYAYLWWNMWKVHVKIRTWEHVNVLCAFIHVKILCWVWCKMMHRWELKRRFEWWCTGGSWKWDLNDDIWLVISLKVGGIMCKKSIWVYRGNEMGKRRSPYGWAGGAIWNTWRWTQNVSSL